MRTKNHSNNNTCHSTLEKEKYDVQKQKQTRRKKRNKFNSFFFYSQIEQVIFVNCIFLRINFYQLERQEHLTTFVFLGHSYPSGGGA